MGLFFLPRQQNVDTSGNPLSGAKLYFYEPGGTSTAKDTYSDLALTTAHANPVVADSLGRWDAIYLNGYYYVELKTSADVSIWTEDNVSSGSVGALFSETESLTATTAIDSTYENKHIRITGTSSLTLLA